MEVGHAWIGGGGVYSATATPLGDVPSGRGRQSCKLYLIYIVIHL